MHPASAIPRAWTGDGPANPALSMVIAALSLVAENLSPSIQLMSTTVAGFDTDRFYRFRVGPVRAFTLDSGVRAGRNPDRIPPDAITSGLSRLNGSWIPERGARLARRDEREYREYREYLSEEQRREPGWPARRALPDQPRQATSAPKKGCRRGPQPSMRGPPGHAASEPGS